MDKKTLKLEILDPTSKTVSTHFVYYSASEGNKLRLTITDNTYIMDKNGKLVILTQEEIEQEEQRKKPKIGDLLYTDPKTGKVQTLFETLLPVFTVCCRNIVIGDKGCAIYFTVQAKDEDEAINIAMRTKAFTKHIRMKDFEKKYLDVFKPKGNYVIGNVNYYEGNEKL